MHIGERRYYCTQGTQDIKCPFFKMHNSKEIVCEGIITGQLNKGEGSLNVLAFVNQDMKGFYQQTFCENRYKRCPYYQMLMQKYDGE